jgi:hypothetical protein
MNKIIIPGGNANPDGAAGTAVLLTMDFVNKDLRSDGPAEDSSFLDGEGEG